MRTLEFNCCGDPHVVANTMARLEVLEKRLGPAYTLSKRLQSMDVTQAELATVYETLLQGERDAPPLSAIKTWIAKAGTPLAAVPLCDVVLAMVVGDEFLSRYAAVDGKLPEAHESERPFGTTAASTGGSG